MPVRPQPLPGHALLGVYTRDGGYTDCFMTEIPRAVTHAQYVVAFYTTWVFKLERWILKWAVARPSTDEDARRLGGGTRLYFGSAVVPVRDRNTGQATLGRTYSALLGFHTLYSRILLGAAARRLGR